VSDLTTSVTLVASSAPSTVRPAEGGIASLPEEALHLLEAAGDDVRHVRNDGRVLARELVHEEFRTEAPLPMHLRSFGCALANGYVYVAGGTLYPKP
jgi:hypothetical protein